MWIAGTADCLVGFSSFARLGRARCRSREYHWAFGEHRIERWCCVDDVASGPSARIRIASRRESKTNSGSIFMYARGRDWYWSSTVRLFSGSTRSVGLCWSHPHIAAGPDMESCSDKAKHRCYPVVDERRLLFFKELL